MPDTRYDADGPLAAPPASTPEPERPESVCPKCGETRPAPNECPTCAAPPPEEGLDLMCPDCCHDTDDEGRCLACEQMVMVTAKEYLALARERDAYRENVRLRSRIEALEGALLVAADALHDARWIIRDKPEQGPGLPPPEEIVLRVVDDAEKAARRLLEGSGR